MTEPQAALAWCPFPDAETARDIAAELLGQKLIACANIVPAIESVFEWDGAMSSAQEVGVLFKTTAETLGRLVEQLGELHPYDTPAIMAWSCDASHPSTLDWLGEVVGASRSGA